MDNDIIDYHNIVQIEVAKQLKFLGFDGKCEYFYQDVDLPYSERGLKKTKNGELLNHNAFDEFVYSAPNTIVAVDWMLKQIKKKFEDGLN